jgi:hypothetical protein
LAIVNAQFAGSKHLGIERCKAFYDVTFKEIFLPSPFSTVIQLSKGPKYARGFAQKALAVLDAA